MSNDNMSVWVMELQGAVNSEIIASDSPVSQFEIQNSNSIDILTSDSSIIEFVFLGGGQKTSYAENSFLVADSNGNLVEKTQSETKTILGIDVTITADEKTAITHSNRTTLDLITEAFTTALKNVYDGAVSWISTNGTNILNHIGITSGNPHGTTAENVGAVPITVNDVNSLPAQVGASNYTLIQTKQNSITGILPAGVSSTLTIESPVSGKINETILHFSTNTTAIPTIIYSGFTPIWLGETVLSMKVNKNYTIVFEQVEVSSGQWVVKTSWGQY